MIVSMFAVRSEGLVIGGGLSGATQGLREQSFASGERICAKIVIDYGHDDAKRSSEGSELQRLERRPARSPGERGENAFISKRNAAAESLYSRRRSPSPAPRTEPTPKPQPRVISAAEVFLPPARTSRAPFIALIIRGLPGSGKSHLCRQLKELEQTHGVANEVRVMTIDDYYLVENDAKPEDGKESESQEMIYVHDASMESAYESSLLKAFTKQVESRHFSLLIVDAPNSKMDCVNRLAVAAKENQYTVLVMETEEKDPKVCHERNIHNRTLEDIEKMAAAWEPTTASYVVLDPKGLNEQSTKEGSDDMDIQDSTSADELSKTEDGTSGELSEESKPLDEAEAEGVDQAPHTLAPSKWETFENDEEKLARLDGGGYKKSSGASAKSTSIEAFLAVTEDYEERGSAEKGKKRVRWADIEQRKNINRAKAIGFVVGQTNWTAFTDVDSEADAALNKTKYFDTESDV